MSTRKYLIHFFVTSFLIVSVSCCLSYKFEPLLGDLTRLGFWPEEWYGWNTRQPKVLRAPNELPIHPDILVLGDSFSAPNTWQSEIAQETGLRFLTYHFQSVCVEELPALLKMIDPDKHIKYVIVETIERQLVSSLQDSLCRGDIRAAKPVSIESEERHFGERPKIFLEKNQTLDIVYLTRTAINVLRLSLDSDRDLLSGDTLNVRLSRHDLFSSKQSGRLLLYNGDLGKNSWTIDEVRTSASKLERVASALDGTDRKLYLLLIPDKSTAYRKWFEYDRYFPDPPLLDAISKRGFGLISPETHFQHLVDAGVRDLYLPDDTHLGPVGYKHLAVYTAKALGLSE